MTVVRLIIVFVIAIIMVAVVVANREPTSLDLLVKRIDMPLYLVILLAWVFGLVSYAIFALFGEIRLRTRLARSRREIDGLTRELNDLRNLPLSEEGTAAEVSLSGDTIPEQGDSPPRGLRQGSLPVPGHDPVRKSGGEQS